MIRLVQLKHPKQGRRVAVVEEGQLRLLRGVDSIYALAQAALAKGGAPPDSSFWGIAADAFGHGAKPPTFSIDVRDWVPRKLAALRCHRTQMGPHNPIAWINDDEAREWLGAEQFRRAPIDATGEPLLEHFGEIQHAD